MAWADLEPILRREGLARDAPRLADQIRHAADTADPRARRRALDAVAAELGRDGHAARLLLALAGGGTPAARQLALELAARPAVRPDAGLVTRLRPLLRDRRIPTAVRLLAAAAFVRAVPSADADAVLRDFAAGYGKARLLERRAGLRKRFGRRRRRFDRFADRLADRLPLRCPRCPVKLPQEAMGRHLWEVHRLLFDGRRVRSPWRLIDHWAAGPNGGPAAAHRQLLRRGADGPSRAALRRDAARRHAGLCPKCFAAVPLDPAAVPSPQDLTPLNLAHGRLSGHGFVLELTPAWQGSRLRIETPAGVLFDGPEPGGRPARRNWRRFVVAAAVLLALVLAAALSPRWAAAGTLVMLAVALFLSAGLRSGEPDDRPDRIVDHAWQSLVPHLHAGGFDPAAADFLAALAVTSVGRGDPAARERLLARLANLTRRAARAKAARSAHLIALERLRVADAAAAAGDPVRALADALRPFLAGPLSPAAAEFLLTDDLTAGWTRGEFARLRVLLVARAFEDGLGVWDLHALGRAVPTLGRVLWADDTDGLARLRLLWDARPTRPWRRCGPAATVFELAKYPMLGGQHLETAPDLLLFQPVPAGGEPVHLLACGRGLIVGGALIHDWPIPIDSRPLPLSKGGGHELLFGPNAVPVHGDVDEVVRRLKVWAAYLFEEFLPWIGNALTRPGDGSPARLAPLTITCPECGTLFLARRGDFGRPVQPGGG